MSVNLRNGCPAMTTSQCPLLLGLSPLQSRPEDMLIEYRYTAHIVPTGLKRGL